MLAAATAAAVNSTAQAQASTLLVRTTMPSRRTAVVGSSLRQGNDGPSSGGDHASEHAQRHPRPQTRRCGVALGGLWGCIANPGATPSPTFYRASHNAIATTVIDSMTNESRRGGDLSRICFRAAPRCLRRCAWPHPACRQRRLAIHQTLAQDHDRRSRGVGIIGA